MADYKYNWYIDKKGEYRWRLTADNGEIVAASTEGYQDKRDMIANAQLVLGNTFEVSK